MGVEAEKREKATVARNNNVMEKMIFKMQGNKKAWAFSVSPLAQIGSWFGADLLGQMFLDRSSGAICRCSCCWRSFCFDSSCLFFVVAIVLEGEPSRFEEGGHAAASLRPRRALQGGGQA